MKLVIAEKPSVAQSLARVIGADKRRDATWKAANIWSAGVLAIWLSFPRRSAMMSALPSGGWKTCRSCRSAGCMRFLRPPGSSTRF